MMAKTAASMKSGAVRSPHESNVMMPSVITYLLQYRNDGEYTADPVTIDAHIVEDERYGMVLEIPPAADGSRR
jgi:hypothetical protein